MTSTATHQLELSTLQRRWVEESEAIMLGLLPNLIRFNSDDLHQILNPPAQPNWFGVLMSKLRARGAVNEVGRITSKRREANGRKIAVWEPTIFLGENRTSPHFAK